MGFYHSVKTHCSLYSFGWEQNLIWSLRGAGVFRASASVGAFLIAHFKQKGTEFMEVYKQMYIELFNAITDEIERLKALQQKVEEMYINNTK